MEPTAERPDVRVRANDDAVALGTAMEPTKNRPDDKLGAMLPGGQYVPQWSRPRTGRLTGTARVLYRFGRPPQWSQPRTDWMTAPVPDVQRDDHDAAMDPTENRPDDRPFWASRSSSTISRNGAGHELAG